MKVTLYYDIDDDTVVEYELVHIKMKDVGLTIELTKKDQKLSITELYEKYKKNALATATYRYMSEYGDFVSNGLRNY